jgi:hypothetical protein
VFVGFAYMVGLSSKTLSGNRRGAAGSNCSPKKTRRENLSPRIMMQERNEKLSLQAVSQ